MFVKLITVAFSLWIAISAPALADWTPTFDPDVHVYIDPALVNNPSAPVKFGSELKSELSKYKRTNYYVVALESSYQGTGKIGVDATDRVINSWSNLDNFPNDDYALIVWARSAFDTSKGGFGKNVSTDLQLISNDIDTKSIIKANMPRNPKGALLSYVNEFEKFLNIRSLLIAFACVLMGIVVAMLLGVTGLFDTIKYKITIADRSKAEVDKWDKASLDLTNRLLVIAEQDVIGFYFKLYPDSANLARLNQTLYQLVRLSDLIFNTYFEAKILHSSKEYQKVLDILTQNILAIDYNSEGGNFGGARTINTQWILDEVATTLYGIEADIKIVEQNEGLDPVIKPEPEIAKPKPVTSNVYSPAPDRSRKWTVDNSTNYIHNSLTNNWSSSSGSDTVLRPSDPAPSSSSSWFSSGDDYSSSDSNSDGDDY